MPVWWGNHDLSESDLLLKQIGPLLLGVRKFQDEWRFYFNRQADWDDFTSIAYDLSEDCLLDANVSVERFMVHNVKPIVSLIPVLADRPFVIQTETPFYVPSNQSVVTFVVTPVWVKISIGENPVELTEVPVMRPSDTWFGADTIRGELSYASFTKARLAVDELPKHHHMAVTPVEICNEASSNLLLEKINLPVTCLSLYEVAGKYLWTQGVRMVRKEDDESAVLEIGKGPPAQAESTVFLSGPRDGLVEDNILRTIRKRLFL